MGNHLVTSAYDHQIKQTDLGNEISRILKNKQGVSKYNSLPNSNKVNLNDPVMEEPTKIKACCLGVNNKDRNSPDSFVTVRIPKIMKLGDKDGNFTCNNEEGCIYYTSIGLNMKDTDDYCTNNNLGKQFIPNGSDCKSYMINHCAKSLWERNCLKCNKRKPGDYGYDPTRPDICYPQFDTSNPNCLNPDGTPSYGPEECACLNSFHGFTMNNHPSNNIVGGPEFAIETDDDIGEYNKSENPYGVQGTNVQGHTKYSLNILHSLNQYPQVTDATCSNSIAGKGQTSTGLSKPFVGGEDLYGKTDISICSNSININYSTIGDADLKNIQMSNSCGAGASGAHKDELEAQRQAEKDQLAFFDRAKNAGFSSSAEYQTHLDQQEALRIAEENRQQACKDANLCYLFENEANPPKCSSFANCDEKEAAEKENEKLKAAEEDRQNACKAVLNVYKKDKGINENYISCQQKEEVEQKELMCQANTDSLGSNFANCNAEEIWIAAEKTCQQTNYPGKNRTFFNCAEKTEYDNEILEYQRQLKAQEDKCKSEVNPQTNTNFETCAAYNEYLVEQADAQAIEDACKSEKNPQTNTNFESCKDKSDYYIWLANTTNEDQNVVSNENLIKADDLANAQKKADEIAFDAEIEKRNEEECKKDGFSSCEEKEEYYKKLEQEAKDFLTNEKKCIEEGYNDCDEKNREEACKSEGYSSCADKSQKLSENQVDDEIAVVETDEKANLVLLSGIGIILIIILIIILMLVGNRKKPVN